MNKFRKGDKIIARFRHPTTGDRSYIDYISTVLHKAPHHYVLKTKYANTIMSIVEMEERGFVKATKKMIELTLKDNQ